MKKKEMLWRIEKLEEAVVSLRRDITKLHNYRDAEARIYVKKELFYADDSRIFIDDSISVSEAIKKLYKYLGIKVVKKEATLEMVKIEEKE